MGMKYYSVLAVIIAVVASSTMLAQEKATLQPNATVLGILQGSAGKSVELRFGSYSSRRREIATPVRHIAVPGDVNLAAENRLINCLKYCQAQLQLPILTT